MKIRQKHRRTSASRRCRHSAKVVMRLLDLDNAALPLSATGLGESSTPDLGLSDDGASFVTGPTGGKTRPNTPA